MGLQSITLDSLLGILLSLPLALCPGLMRHVLLPALSGINIGLHMDQPHHRHGVLTAVTLLLATVLVNDTSLA